VDWLEEEFDRNLLKLVAFSTNQWGIKMSRYSMRHSGRCFDWGESTEAAHQSSGVQDTPVGLNGTRLGLLHGSTGAVLWNPQVQ